MSRVQLVRTRWSNAVSSTDGIWWAEARGSLASSGRNTMTNARRRIRNASALVVLAWVLPWLAHAENPCVFNPEMGRYQVCLDRTADGRCVQYGQACGESGQPRFNPRTGAYQECLQVGVSGECIRYGPRRAPEGECMFNPRTGAYHKCIHVTTGGGCAEYGPPCN